MTQIQLFDFISGSALMSFLDNDSEETVKTVLNEVPKVSGLLSDSFIDAMKSKYKSRVVSVFMRATGEVLVKQMRIIDPFGAADPTEACDDTVYRALENAVRIIGCDGSYYYEKYPIVSDYMDVMRKNFIESETEFLDNFYELKGLIEKQFFGGRKIDHLIGFTSKGGDSHRHGRSVTGVRSNAGNFYYKPHDCRLDILYHTLITELFSDCTVAADCVTREGCGFVTELAAMPIESTEDLSLYYFNFGRLLAVFHGIGAVDMHLDNILPSGVKPCAIDLETMFKPEVGKRSRHGVVTLTSQKRTGRNVLRTAVLPWYLPGIGLLSPLYRQKLLDEDYLPECGGKRFTVEGFEKDFISGFEDGYDDVRKNRSRIMELFQSAEECELRVLLRNTEYYNRMRQFLWTPKALCDRKEQRRILDRLRVPFTNNRIDVNEDIVKYEEKCLLEGDIPYYCTTLDGVDLCGCSVGEVVTYGYMSKSARTKTFEDLEQLSGTDKVYECDLIRNSFMTVATDIVDKASGTEILHSDDKEALDKKARALISKICKGITECQIRKPDGNIMFVPSTPIIAGKRSSSDAVHCADAAVMLHLADEYGLVIDHNVFRNALSTIKNHVKKWQMDDPIYVRSVLNLGICGGVAEFISLLDEIPEADDIFMEIIDLAEEKQLYLIEDKKDAKALAELMISIGKSGKEHFKKTDIIRRCADRLVGYFDAESGDVMCLAAAGSAFTIAGALLKTGEYDQYAKNAFTHLNSLFNEKIVGWPDNNVVFKSLPECLNYSPYIGICACLAADVNDDAKRTAELSVKSVLNESMLRYCDSLYHGNALTVRFLVYAAEIFDRPELMDRVRDIIFTMIRRRDVCGAFHTSPAGIRDFFDVSYVFGTLGIGATLLQLKLV